MARTIKKKASTVAAKHKADKVNANRKLRKRTKQQLLTVDDYEDLLLPTRLKHVDDVWNHSSDGLQTLDE